MKRVQLQATTRAWLAKRSTIDQIANNLALGCFIHPTLYEFYLDELEKCEHQKQISLLPCTIFALYHRRLRSTYESLKAA